jgi:hypothetical protein
MENVKIYLFILVTLIILLSSCGSQSNDDHFEIVDETASEEKEHKPSLLAEVKVEEGKATLFVETNLTVSKENYGGAKKNGEGHIHVYVNQGEKQGVTTFPYELKDIKSGLNVVRISLHNNDHTPYGVSREIEFDMN